MARTGKNQAFIDGVNLHKGVQSLGWKLDYVEFLRFLRERHRVETAHLFLGYLEENARMYEVLRKMGYTLTFRPTLPDHKGEVKGNCDAELILNAVKGYYEREFEKAVLVTSDGDFACLARFLQERNALEAIASPEHRRCSVLLKRVTPRITFLEELRDKLEYKKRPSRGKA